MPYFVSHDPHSSTYNAYLDPTRGDGGVDATANIWHRPGDTTMTVGVGKWLSGDQFYKDTVGAIAEDGVAKHIMELQDTKRDYDKGIPFSESDLTYWHKDGVFRRADKDDQLQLFAHNPPKPSYVNYLASRNNPGAKVAAMTMLGMADMDVRAKSGHPLAPSDNLSEHSLRIVRHLGARGAVNKEDIPTSEGNDLSFWNTAEELDQSVDLDDARDLPDYYTDVSDRARDARKHIKSLLRPAKATPKPRGRKPQQLKLFED